MAAAAVVAAALTGADSFNYRLDSALELDVGQSNLVSWPVC